MRRSRVARVGLKVALEEIVRLKPSSSKGRYIQKGAVSTTFGPGIPLDVNALA
jgi:large subunit ribosomal protein L1